MNKNLLWLIFIVIIIFGALGRYWYKTPNVGNGNDAKEIEGKLLNGESFKLSQLKGKYVVVDFWGSWCGPCLKELPLLKKLYESRLNKNDLEIVSVAIEKDSIAWQKRIEEYQMTWKYQISDMNMFNSTIAKTYGIRVIPSKILVNKSGKIIGVNTEFHEIEKLIELGL
jgi:thiol-disulfide isomerase/thioredoxin